MVKAIFTFLGGFCVYVMATLSYPGISLLMAIESACIPLPSELIMPYAGALSDPLVNSALSEQVHVTLTPFNLLLAAVAGALGCNLGSEVAYWVGAKGGRPAILRYGSLLLVSKSEIDLADRWFEKRGDIIIFLARLLPVVRTFIAFPAGISKMNQFRFHLYTFIGSWPWCYALAYVGMRLGASWNSNPRFQEVFHRFHLGVEAVIAVGFVWFVWTHWKNRIRTEAD